MTSLKSWTEQGRISPAVSEQFSRLIDLILEWNPRINLTGFRTHESIEENLIGESIAALSVLRIAGKRVLDFGSGAGIPGLVWAACETSAGITSLEIRQKKVAFQKEVVRVTRIGAEIVAGRFPEAVKGRQFDVIVSRAIRLDAALWRAGEGLLAPGGSFVRFARPDVREQGWECFPVTPATSLLICRL